MPERKTEVIIKYDRANSLLNAIRFLEDYYDLTKEQEEIKKELQQLIADNE